MSIRLLWAFAVSMIVAAGSARAADGRIPIRVVVVTTFERGNDTGDAPGEFQAWVEQLPLPQTLPFPLGDRHLRYDPARHILGIVTGEGAERGAASIMALGTDPRFDLSRAYWVIAGIAGVDPNVASVGSAAWANWVVNGDLGFEIDARDMPHSWSTGIIPFDRRAPFVQPPLPQDNIHGQLAYRLNPGLVDWAYHLTASSPIADDANLRHVRIAYGSFANGRRAPFVLRGDSLDGDRFWMGASMNAWAEGWVRYWTGNRGTFAMTAEEDAGIMQSLTRLAHAGRVDGQRVLVLRTGSDYSTPGTGDDARALLLNDSGVGHYSAFREALAAAYHVGSIVVLQLAVHWERYAAKIPVGDYVAASEAGR